MGKTEQLAKTPSKSNVIPFRPGKAWRTGTDDQRIRFAIAEKRLLQFSLQGLPRVAEPHDYGVRKGVPQLLVYQIGGESRTGKLPDWRWVVLSRASGFEVLDETFDGGRNGDDRKHANWDRVYARVD